MAHTTMNLLDLLIGNVMEERNRNRGTNDQFGPGEPADNENMMTGGLPPDHEHDSDDRLMDPAKSLEMFGAGEMRVFCIDLQSQLHVYCDKDNIVTAQLVTPIKSRLGKPVQYKPGNTPQAKASGLPGNGDYSEMARALGVDPSYVSYIMAGKRRPSLELFFKMADHLHMKPEELQRKLEDLWEKAHPAKK